MRTAPLTQREIAARRRALAKSKGEAEMPVMRRDMRELKRSLGALRGESRSEGRHIASRDR